jgi:hypothetical protein
MSQSLIEKHETLAIEMASLYLDNMEIELGKKYINNAHEINASLSDEQYSELKNKHRISDQEFADLYSEFQKMKPTKHLKMAMDAFTASGGSVDIEPKYSEATQRLSVSITFAIKDKSLDRIEGLSAMEDIILRMNAMLQVDTLLSGSDPDVRPAF